MIPQTIREVYERSTQLFTREEVENAIDQMAKTIEQKLGDQDPVLLCVMNGGVALMGGLLSRLEFPLTMDYIHVTRYRGETSGSVLDFLVKPARSLTGRNVLIVDDILDGGITLAELVRFCEDEGAATVSTCVLIDKPCGRDEGGHQQADFVGLSIDDYFIFGYGMDYHHYLRNAPGIFAVAKDDQ